MRAIQHRDGVTGCWWQQPPRVAARAGAGPYYLAAHAGKMVALQGTNMAHCELGLPEAECLVADRRYSLAVQAK